MNVGPSELLVIGAILIIPMAVVLVIWAVVDAAQRSDAAWAAIGESRAVWIVLLGVSFVLCAVPGLVFAIVYLARTRSKLVAAESGSR